MKAPTRTWLHLQRSKTPKALTPSSALQINQQKSCKNVTLRSDLKKKNSAVPQDLRILTWLKYRCYIAVVETPQVVGKLLLESQRNLPKDSSSKHAKYNSHLTTNKNKLFDLFLVTNNTSQSLPSNLPSSRNCPKFPKKLSSSPSYPQWFFGRTTCDPSDPLRPRNLQLIDVQISASGTPASLMYFF